MATLFIVSIIQCTARSSLISGLLREPDYVRQAGDVQAHFYGYSYGNGDRRRTKILCWIILWKKEDVQLMRVLKKNCWRQHL